jgi:hypothetical protein
MAAATIARAIAGGARGGFAILKERQRQLWALRRVRLGEVVC